MTVILLIFAAIGIAPLALGLSLAARRVCLAGHASILGSILLCALAFNLVFFWQELWLAIPKALTPGLHPVLFHNNHDWTGDAPTVKLLQGSGTLATFAMGLASLALLARMQRLAGTVRLFCFWMAFQGLTQAFTQLAVGSVLPATTSVER